MGEFYNKEVLLDFVKNNTPSFGDSTTMQYVVKTIEEAPTTDAVEVVRCSDCAFWGGVTFGFVCRKFSGRYTKICMHKDSYCCYGERKENQWKNQ